MSQSSRPSGEVLTPSAAGTTFLILIQLASRIFTFASNQLILRTLSPAVLGVAAQLELYQVSILYFSRESIRLAVQRQPLSSISSPRTSSSKEDSQGRDSSVASPNPSQTVVNISYLSILQGIPVALIFTLLYQHLAAEHAEAIPFFHTSVAVTGIAAFMELSIEPFFAIIQQQMRYDKRAAVEMPAAFLKSFATCFSFLYLSRVGYSTGALPFALGYLGYSITLICGYWLLLLPQANERSFSYFLKTLPQHGKSEYFLGLFSRRLTTLATSVFFQSVVKHLLTQGDSMMLAALSTLEDQGIYSLAANYGGLVARIIFQPIEESSRNMFSKLLTPDERGERKKDQVRLSKAHLVDILQAYQLLSVLIFPIGPAMVPHALSIVGGQHWASSRIGDLLSLYCYYIPFLAFNGITEAFVASSADSKQIRIQTIWMGMFSACYALAAYLFLRVGDMGAYGLVLANIMNMAVRTLWSYIFIRSFLCKHGDALSFSEASVRPVTFALMAIATTIQATPEFSKIAGIISTMAMSAMYAILILYIERKYILRQWERMRHLIPFRGQKSKPE